MTHEQVLNKLLMMTCPRDIISGKDHINKYVYDCHCAIVEIIATTVYNDADEAVGFKDLLISVR